ncbi:hypothetical protein DFH28DRAFT_972650 [Melampsora americana]|nr:hypothetical protein DFH28DRAFT_972650 [Melampsora americana]
MDPILTEIQSCMGIAYSVSLVRCVICGKATWSGCGLHGSDIMSEVPVGDQCKCPRAEKMKKNASL